MVRIKQQPELPIFDTKVRKPGNEFLKNNPNTKSSEYPPYWLEIQEEFAEIYDYICAYLGLYDHSGEIDHFIPKSEDKTLVYEWSNYRYCSNKVNKVKSFKSITTDPFTINNGDILLDVSIGEVYANTTLDKDRQETINNEISLLGLNKHRFCNTRLSYLNDYEKGHAQLASIERTAPFIAEFIKSRIL